MYNNALSSTLHKVHSLWFTHYGRPFSVAYRHCKKSSSPGFCARRRQHYHLAVVTPFNPPRSDRHTSRHAFPSFRSYPPQPSKRPVRVVVGYCTVFGLPRHKLSLILVLTYSLNLLRESKMGGVVDAH